MGDEADRPKTPQHHKEWKALATANADHSKSRADSLREKLQQLHETEVAKCAHAESERHKAELAAIAGVARRRKEAKEAEEAAIKAYRMAEKKRREEEQAAAEAAAAAAVVAAAVAARKERLKAEELKQKQWQFVMMSEATSKVMKAVLECQHASRTKFCYTKVCDMRSELRTKRPREERIPDHVEAAVVAEKQVLIDAREELEVLIKAGKKAAAGMEEVKYFLSSGDCREAMKDRRNKHDELQRSCSLPSLISPATCPSPFSSPPGTAQSKLGSSTRSGKFWEFRNMPVQELLARSRELCAESLDIAHRSVEVIARTNEACQLVTAKSTACLDKRKIEINEMKQVLIKEKKDADGVINYAQARITELQMKNARLKEVPQSDLEQLQAAEDAVKELQAARIKVEDDIRKKKAAFKIEESCRNCTTVRGSSHTEKLPPTGKA